MKIKLRDGDTMLIMVKDGEVIHFMANASLWMSSGLGELPAGAWVGMVSKANGGIAATSSKYFLGYQLPTPTEVLEAVRRNFE